MQLSRIWRRCQNCSMQNFSSSFINQTKCFRYFCFCNITKKRKEEQNLMFVRGIKHSFAVIAKHYFSLSKSREIFGLLKPAARCVDVDNFVTCVSVIPTLPELDTPPVPELPAYKYTQFSKHTQYYMHGYPHCAK